MKYLTLALLLFSGVPFCAAEKTPALSRDADRLVVAADGSGDFTTIQAAVNFSREHRPIPVEIFIKQGHYEELVRIGREHPNLHLVGEDRDHTVIAYTNNEKLHSGWIQRAVVGVDGDGFVLENLTVQNTTPYKGSQAEALYVNADRCVLRHATFRSFQDTLNLSGRVYVHDCYVEGDVDYVWGVGTAVFERCELRTLHDGFIVQARNPANRPGYVFRDCRFTAGPEARQVWLARIEAQRFPFSHVAFVRCAFGPHILPAGWQVTGTPTENLRFQEFASCDLDGNPLDLQTRTHSHLLTPTEAAELTPSKLLSGDDGWDPAR